MTENLLIPDNRHSRRAADTIDRLGLSPLAYRIPDACAVLGLGRTSVYELIAEGKLRAIKVAGRTLVDAESARALIAGAPDRSAA